MNDIEITIPAGGAKRLLTAGKRHTRNIVVTAEGGEGYDQGYTEGYDDGYYYGYENGYADGEESGVQNGLESGMAVAYDTFWDAFQDNGNRTNYQRAFAVGWTDSNYNPKYPFVCGNLYEATEMFFESKITDTKVPITLSNTRADSMFYKCTELRRVHLLICENVLRWSTTFRECAKLEEINIQGEIGTSIDISPCPLLTAASVQSIIDHLKDLTGQTAQTLTFHATVGGKLTAEQKAAISAKNWTLVY